MSLNIRWLILIFAIFLLNYNLADDDSDTTPSQFLVIGPNVMRDSAFKVIVIANNNPTQWEEFTLVRQDDGNTEYPDCKIFNGITNIHECTFGRLDGDFSKYKLSLAHPEHPKIKNSTKMSERKQSVEIVAVKKKFSIMIQTDKLQYKPGDVFNMRLFFIHNDGSPVSTDELRNFHVEIRNKVNDVVIHTFTDRQYEVKVYNSTIRLHDEAFKGEYRIYVWTNLASADEGEVDEEDRFVLFKDIPDMSEAFSRKFYISKEDLPELKLYVETQRTTRPNGKINLKIYGRYSFGKNACGKAALHATVRDGAYIAKEHKNEITIQEEGTYTIDLREDMKILSYIQRYDIGVEVKFTDDLTKQTLTETVRVTVTDREILKLIIDPDEALFKPGSPYMVNVYLHDIDDKPIEQSKRHDVVLTVRKKFKTPECDAVDTIRKEETYEQVGSKQIIDGKARFEVRVPYNTTNMIFKASYGDRVEASFTSVRTATLTKQYFYIEPIQRKMPNRDFSVKVKSNVKFDDIKIVYLLAVGAYGQMNLQRMSTVSKRYEHKFNVKFMEWMVPSVNIIAFFYGRGEYIFDATKVHFDKFLSNEVSIKIVDEYDGQNGEYLPGGEITVEFDLDKNKNDEESTLHILSVDERVRYLGNGNDIDLEMFNAETNKKSSRDEEIELPVVEDRVDERYDGLSKFNTFFITDHYVLENDCPEVRRRKIKQSGEDESETEVAGDQKPEVKNKVRKNFDEVFIFRDVEGSEIVDNKYTYKGNVPDSISKFLVNAFVFHPTHGLGIAREKKFTVWKDMFIKLFLPYSIHVDEVLKINVAVFNYLQNSVETKLVIELFKPDRESTLAHEFVKPSKDRSGTCQYSIINDKSLKPKFTIQKNSYNKTHFFIRAKSLGRIGVRVTAQAEGEEHDVVEKIMRIEPEGISQSKNTGYFIDLRKVNGSQITNSGKQFECVFPSNIVANTRKVGTTVYGNILGQVISNTEKLIDHPTGCPEQLFMKWVPNIVAYDYLNAIGKLNDKKRNDLMANINTGYQSIVLKQGNFTFQNYWDKYDSVQSTGGKFTLNKGSSDHQIWFTAYLAKLLGIAKHAAGISNVYEMKALTYLKQIQKNSRFGNDKGSFKDRCHISYYCDGNSSIALTAFTVSAFLESEQRDDFKEEINAGIQYLMWQAQSLETNFQKAITAYAFSRYLVHNRLLAAENVKKLNKNLLKNLIERSHKTDDKVYWYQSSVASGNEKSAVNIETAAYIMQALLIQNDRDSTHVSNALKVMNWLLSVKNSVGGFESSHDSVVAIKALGAISKEFINVNKTKINVQFKYDGNKIDKFDIDDKNNLNVQQKLLQRIPNQVDMSATGTGIGFAAVACSYFEKTERKSTSYHLEVGATKLDAGVRLNVSICAYDKETTDGMTIIEVNSPSGYVFMQTGNKDLRSAGVMKVELEHEGQRVHLYFDPLAKTRTCFNMIGYRQNEVSSIKAAPVRVYRYIDRDMKYAVAYYNPGLSENCD